MLTVETLWGPMVALGHGRSYEEHVPRERQIRVIPCERRYIVADCTDLIGQVKVLGIRDSEAEAERLARGEIAPTGQPRCRHCRKAFAGRHGRGLCKECWSEDSVKEQYKPFPPTKRRES